MVTCCCKLLNARLLNDCTACAWRRSRYLSAPPWLGQWIPSGEQGLIKDILEALLCECRALEKRIGSNIPGNGLPFGGGDGLLTPLREAIEFDGIFPEIHLAAAQNHVTTRTDALDLGGPATFDVFQGRVMDDGVAENEDIGLVVGEGSEALVVLLAGGI